MLKVKIIETATRATRNRSMVRRCFLNSNRSLLCMARLLSILIIACSAAVLLYPAASPTVENIFSWLIDGAAT
jgi:hypothetical protein